MNQSLQTALHHQMNTLHDIIKRMAENSRNVKTWCVTLLAALLAFSSATTALPLYVFVLPIISFMYLDMYYLALETFFIAQYNKLIQSYSEGTVGELNVYNMESPNGKLSIFYQFRSKSVWPFYGVLFVLAALVSYFFSIQ